MERNMERNFSRMGLAPKNHNFSRSVFQRQILPNLDLFCIDLVKLDDFLDNGIVEAKTTYATHEMVSTKLSCVEGHG